jgi:type IV pilus assembly protein PilF
MMRWHGVKCILFALLVPTLLAACAKPSFTDTDTDPVLSAQSKDVQRRSAIRMELAKVYYEKGQYKLALDEIKLALSLTPDSADAYSLRALVLMDMNDPKRAEENFLHAMKLSENSSEVVNNYAWFLCQNKQEKKALTYFDKVINDRSYRTPIMPLMNAGVCSLRLKDLVGAERYFKLASREDPMLPNVNANLAIVYFGMNDFAKAKFYIDRVLKMEVMTADVLWLAIKIENKLGDQLAVSAHGTQLRRRHPNSNEYSSFQRGAFNE